MSTDEEISRLFQIRQAIMEILRERGYANVDYELTMSRQQFIQLYGETVKREDIIIKKSMHDDDSDQIYVFFPREPKIGLKKVRTYIEHMESQNVFRAILVVQQNPAPFIMTCLKEISETFHLEFFQEAELLVNNKEHVRVPEHQLLTNEEKKDFVGETVCQRNAASLESDD